MTGKLLALRRVDGAAHEMSDEALVAACGVGDSTALATLFDRYHAAAFRFLSRLCGKDADIDDLVQATFIELQRSAASFAGKSSVRTWILGIAANLARHFVRSQIRRRALMTAVADCPPCSVPRPDDAAEHRELIARLGEALAKLPHHLREAFVMFELEEVPGIDAARALGVREGTLWRRLHEARKLLRSALEGHTA